MAFKIPHEKKFKKKCSSKLGDKNPKKYVLKFKFAYVV